MSAEVTSPNPLSTPTDLSREGVERVSDAINPLVADALALYVKTKNYHWHLSGARFRDLHLLFDEQAAAIFTMVDALAERVRRIGGTTIRSVGHVAKLQTIEDDDESFVSPDEMLRRLLIDNKDFAARQRAAHQVCEDANDVATASLLEDTINETERHTWFLYEYLKDTDRFD